MEPMDTIKKLLTTGLSNEPFLCSVLDITYKAKTQDLLARARIRIPNDKGRSMMGTVDETGVLEYGEVFIRYSQHIHKPHTNLKVHLDKVDKPQYFINLPNLNHNHAFLRQLSMASDIAIYPLFAQTICEQSRVMT